MNESEVDNSDNEFEGLTIEKVEQLKRSQLQIKSTFDWLKSRHSKNVKKRYLFFPEDIKRQLEIKNIFQNFDRDHSNALDQSEMFEMFQNNGFKISEQDLKRFFLVVDEDKDNALNWQEFKKTAFNEKAGAIFTSIMRKIRKQEENNEGNGKDPKFLPMSFGSMISYLSFCTSREELKGSIEKDSSLSQFDRFKKYQEMFHLTNQYSKKTKFKNSISDVSQLIEEEKQEDDQLFEEKQFIQETNKKLKSGLKSLGNTHRPVISMTSHNKLRQKQQTEVLKSPSSSQSEVRSNTINKRFSKRLQEMEVQMGLKGSQSHSQLPQFPSLIKVDNKIQKKQAKIDSLKKEVLNYVELAKTKYKIDIYKPYLGAESQKNLQIKPVTFETEYINQESLARRSILNSTPNLFHVAQLPKIEESILENLSLNNKIGKSFKSKSSYNQNYLSQQDFDDHLPQFVVNKLRIHKISSQLNSTKYNTEPKIKMARTNSEKFKSSFNYTINADQTQKSGFNHIKRTASQQQNNLYHTSTSMNYKAVQHQGQYSKADTHLIHLKGVQLTLNRVLDHKDKEESEFSEGINLYSIL